MFTLSKKLNQQAALKKEGEAVTEKTKLSIRDRLLSKEVPEMEENMPRTCRVHFEDPNKLHKFSLTIQPDEGFWQGGKFTFTVEVPEEYNIAPPVVGCRTKIWHPNINESGEVCLSLLRQKSFDGMGWAPTRKLKDVVWGLNSLFSDLLNFDDPLNVDAADQFLQDKEAFKAEVRDYIENYCNQQ